MSIEGKVISLPYIFQVLYVLCFTRPRYQVSVYRTIGPLFFFSNCDIINDSVACYVVVIALSSLDQVKNNREKVETSIKGS